MMTFDTSVVAFGVDENMSLDVIQKEVEKYEEIVMLFHNFKHNGAFSGSITIVFIFEENRDRFLEKVKSMTINDKEITFQKYSSTFKNDVIFNLHIRNIPKSWNDDDLKEYCAKFGEISSCIRIQKREDFIHGFVCYADKTSYNNALNSTPETVSAPHSLH